MTRTFFILLVTLFCSCKTQDKKAADNSANQQISSGDTVTQLTNSPNCKKCDKDIIETATENWDKLSDAQVEQFLCSFDKKCKLEEKYKNSGGTYSKVAFEMLVVQLDRHLNTCTKLFDTNKDIDFTFILSLLKNVAGHDLPWPSIISQLDNKTTLTPTEQKIFDTIKNLRQTEKRNTAEQNKTTANMNCVKN